MSTCIVPQIIKKTVLKLFEEAIRDHGAPSRIRTDKGGKTTLFWELMTEIRGNGGGIFLASSSVHNQRIEWLWRDLWNAVCCVFYVRVSSNGSLR